MAEASVTIRPPLWRNVRALRIAGQIGFVVVVFVVLQQMYLNAAFNLSEQGRDLSYGFLDTRTGFGIKEHIVRYNANSPIWRAYLVAVTNALLVALSGIVLATLVGLVLGIARLSHNWLVRKIAQVYVDVIRNTPLLVQMVFWYVGVILAIPAIGRSLSLGGIAFVSNRGAAIPAIRGDENFAAWELFALAGLIAAVGVRIWRTRVYERTGRPHYRNLIGLGVFLAFAIAGYVILGDAFHIETPELRRFNYRGGIQMSPEFAGVLIALVIYTAAFIGEIVRGSILAVSKGQKEAAQALGLRPGQQLRLVVLPQAMRIAIPPINNQYLNLWKNTSLAFAIGFPELINVTTTIINQAGHELELFMMVVLTYLFISLVISFLMNILNRAVALRGAPV